MLPGSYWWLAVVEPQALVNPPASRRSRMPHIKVADTGPCRIEAISQTRRGHRIHRLGKISLHLLHQSLPLFDISLESRLLKERVDLRIAGQVVFTARAKSAEGSSARLRPV